MKETKMQDVSFLEREKETFKERLRTLIGDRSVRSAAKDWGLSVSTLNNYLNRDTEPALAVVKTIAKHEKVSLDWLASGDEEVSRAAPRSLGSGPAAITSDDYLQRAWMMVFEVMAKSEAEEMIRFINRHGIKSVLNRAIEFDLLQNEFNLNHYIDAQPIRPTLKQIIKMVLTADESADKEILQIVTNATHADAPDPTKVNQAAEHKAAG
ncbi:helix-turn-helix domain-containing protein [Erwinia aphidicola]|nr:helix-turn-helix domain-containing protein [Erwinia aphidicola]